MRVLAEPQYQADLFIQCLNQTDSLVIDHLVIDQKRSSQQSLPVLYKRLFFDVTEIEKTTVERQA